MRNICLTAILLAFALGLSAQSKMKWFKSARKAQATCYTYDHQGNTIGRSNAIFIEKDGNVLTRYDILKGAETAEIITSDGKKHMVASLVKASSLYNTAILRIDGTFDGLSIATADATEGTVVHIMPPLGSGKHTLCKDVSIAKSDEIENGHHYYHLVSQPQPNTDASLTAIFSKDEECLPVLNTSGQLLGVTQYDATNSTNQEKCYAASARHISTQNNSGTGFLSSNYQQVNIPLQLPNDQKEAETMLFLMPKKNKTRYTAMVRQYISRYPQSTFGYTTLGEFLASNGETEATQALYTEALNNIKGEGRDEIYFSLSRVLASDTTTYAQALDACDEAYKIKNEPVYLKQKADLLFELKRHDEAREAYLALSTTRMRSAEIFLSAAYCSQADQELYLSLLDSAMNCYTKPYPKEAITALWLRAAARHDAGKYRLAVSDYNEFEHLAAGRVTAEFYYRRSISEVAGRLYQQAIDDAHKAIGIQENNTELLIHLANIYLRLGMTDEARPILQKAADFGEPGAKEWLDSHQE